VAILRPARTPKGTEVRTVVKHVTKRLRQHWPNTRIVWEGQATVLRTHAASAVSVSAARSRAYDQRVSVSFWHGFRASRKLSCIPSAKFPDAFRSFNPRPQPPVDPSGGIMLPPGHAVAATPRFIESLIKSAVSRLSAQAPPEAPKSSRIPQCNYLRGTAVRCALAPASDRAGGYVTRTMF
jgi:hypothetical protein